MKATLTKTQKALLKLHKATELRTDGVYNVVVNKQYAFIYRVYRTSKTFVNKVKIGSV